MKLLVAATILALVPGFAIAEGHADAVAGEKVFKKCQACHVVRDPDGNVLAGRAGKTGPNLFGIVGQGVGGVEGFRYRKSMKEAGAAGLVWTEALLAAYLLDPSGFLKEQLGDSGARSGMTFRLRKQEEADNIAAFLAQFTNP